MTKAELIAMLEDLEDDDEVRLISQPDRHPLEYRLNTMDSGIVEDDKGKVRLYLVEGSQVGYADGDALDQLGLG